MKREERISDNKANGQNFFNSKSDCINWCSPKLLPSFLWLTPQVGIRTLRDFEGKFIHCGLKSPASIQDKIRFSQASTLAVPPNTSNKE